MKLEKGLELLAGKARVVLLNDAEEVIYDGKVESTSDRMCNMEVKTFDYDEEKECFCFTLTGDS